MRERMVHQLVLVKWLGRAAAVEAEDIAERSVHLTSSSNQSVLDDLRANSGKPVIPNSVPSCVLLEPRAWRFPRVPWRADRRQSAAGLPARPAYAKAVVIATDGCAFLSKALGSNVLTGDG